MKKIYFIMIFLITILQFNSSYAQNTGLCEITKARFSQGSLSNFNKKGENLFELTGEDQTQPTIELNIETKNCEQKGTVGLAIFSYSYPFSDRNNVKKLTVAALYDMKITKDGTVTLPIEIGTKACYIGRLTNSDTCRYILGFKDHLNGDKARSGISITDTLTDMSEGDNYHFVGLNRNTSVDIYDYAGKNGITFNCTESTCDKYGFKINNTSASTSLLLNGANSINNGFTSDPCGEIKGDDCYTLLSDIPIPEKTEGQFSISHKNVKAQDSDISIKKTVIQGMFPYQFAVDSFITWFVYIVILLAVFRLVYIGFKKITSESSKNNTESRESFMGVFMGLGICFSFFIILNTINPDILGKGPELKMQTLQALGDIPTSATFSQTIKKTGSSNPTPIDIKINTLPGNAIWFEADMDIDMDGDYNNYSADEKALVQKYDRTTNQDQTSWNFPISKNYPNAFRFPYYVLPPQLASQYGLKLGDLGAIIHGNTIVYAVYADNGPHNKIGEGSAFLARQITPSHTNLGAGLPCCISYVLFPNSAIPDLSSNNWQAKVNEKGAKLFNNVKSSYKK